MGPFLLEGFAPQPDSFKVAGPFLMTWGGNIPDNADMHLLVCFVRIFKQARSSKSIAARMNGLKGVHLPANKINPLEFTEVFSLQYPHLQRYDSKNLRCFVVNDLRVLVELVAMVLAFSRLRSQISLTALFHLNGSYNLLMKNMGLNILFLSFCWVQIICIYTVYTLYYVWIRMDG